LYDTSIDTNLSLCVCRDRFWRISRHSFWGGVRKITCVLTRLWVNGNLSGAFLILDTTEAQLIWWSMLMSSGGHTRLDETWRLFETYAGTPDGSWLTKTRCVVTCRSEFWGCTTMSRPRTTIAELAPEDVVMAFMEFVVDVLSRQERGDPVPKDEGWKHSKGVHEMVLPCVSSYYGRRCDRSWLHSTCPSLRGGYCWAAVGQTASWPIPDHPKHQSHNRQRYGGSWCVFESYSCRHYGEHLG